MKPIYHTFRGRRYRVVFKKPSGAEGRTECPSDPNPHMLINPHLDDAEFLETIIHEGLHACCWDMDEEAITDTASDIAKLAVKQGYRRGSP